MLLRIATAVGVVLLCAGVWYSLSARAAGSGKPTAATAVRVGCLALGSSAWLTLASTAMLWLFPLNVVASAAIGYFGTKSLGKAFPIPEIKALTLLSLLCGAAIAAAIAASNDSFMFLVAGPYSLINAVALSVASYLSLRRRSEA